MRTENLRYNGADGKEYLITHFVDDGWFVVYPTKPNPDGGFEVLGEILRVPAKSVLRLFTSVEIKHYED